MERTSSASCLYLIHSLFDSMSEREKHIAEYVLRNPVDAVNFSIEELAESSSVSVSTLVRFVRKLGYKGYQQFRIALASEALAPEAKIYDTEVDRNVDPIQIAYTSARKALELTSSMIDRNALENLAFRIVQSHQVYIFGLGGSAIVAKDAVHKLVRAGIRCISAEDYHLQLMIASQLKGEDIAILISHTGINKDAISLAEAIKASGAFLSVITSYPRSALARIADMNFTSASSGSLPMSEAFSARIAQLALIDALYISIMTRLGEEGIRNVEKMRATIAKHRL